MVLNNIELNAFARLIEAGTYTPKKTFIERVQGALDPEKEWVKSLVQALRSTVFLSVYKDRRGDVLVD